MQVRELHVALMGCGRIAQRHAQLLGSGQIAGAKLAGVCDVVGERARELGSRYDVPSFEHIDQLMAEMADRVDLIAVLTPSGLHAEHVIHVASYGKDVIVEKPMALRLADADEMIRTCDANGVRLFVVKQNRFNVPVLKLREALEQGRFGKLVLGTVRVRWARDQSYYDQDAWRGTWAYDGGVLANQASHHIDLLEWMMGDVDSVVAKSSTALVDIETEDTGLVLLSFANGALGIVEATTAARPNDLEGSISILGEGGAVEIGGFAVNAIRTWQFGERRTDDDEVLARYSVNPPDVYGYGHKAYYDHVVDCINNGAPQLVDGLEGRRSLELITAIYESIETRQEVFLRFKPTRCRIGQRDASDRTGS